MTTHFKSSGVVLPRADFTFEQLEAEVRRLAEEKPDFVYPYIEVDNTISCYYRPINGRCACIFGRAYLNLGYEFPEAFEIETSSLSIASLLKLTMRVQPTEEQLMWAIDLQGQQDCGTYTWSECVAHADTHVKLFA